MEKKDIDALIEEMQDDCSLPSQLSDDSRKAIEGLLGLGVPKENVYKVLGYAFSSKVYDELRDSYDNGSKCLESKTILDLIYDRCEQILRSKPSYIKCKIMLSEFYVEDGDNKILLTLITDDMTRCTEYRQSDFVTLHTDLDRMIELLYNRTM